MKDNPVVALCSDGEAMNQKHMLKFALGHGSSWDSDAGYWSSYKCLEEGVWSDLILLVSTGKKEDEMSEMKTLSIRPASNSYLHCKLLLCCYNYFDLCVCCCLQSFGS